MIKYIDIKDYKVALKKEDYENVYNAILSASIDLADVIAKIKNIELNSSESLEDELFNIEYVFNKECTFFREIIYLMKDLRNWNYDDVDEEEILPDYDDITGEVYEEKNIKSFKLTLVETKEEKISNYIRRYNSVVTELERYYSIEKEIKNNGYENVIKQRTEKLLQIFKKMLKFKNEKYDENWNLCLFAKKISQYYSVYAEELSSVASAVSMGKVSYDNNEEFIKINEIETIMFMDNFYNELVYDEGYKVSFN